MTGNLERRIARLEAADDADKPFNPEMLPVDALAIGRLPKDALSQLIHLSYEEEAPNDQCA